MRSFKDTNGDAWDIDVNVGVLLRIKSELGVNLLDAPEDIPESVEKLVGILWCCVAKQLQERKITPEEFGCLLDGEAVKAGVDAFMEELLDFFIHLAPAKGRAMKLIWHKSKEVYAQIDKVAEEVVGSIYSGSQESPA